MTLFDKGFWGAELLSSPSGTGTNRHWLIPAKKGMVCEEVARYGQHDRLVRMKVSPQTRKRNPTLPSHREVREVRYEVQGKVKTVMTSLPAKTYNAKAVAKLYQERWEIEFGSRALTNVFAAYRNPSGGSARTAPASSEYVNLSPGSSAA